MAWFRMMGMDSVEYHRRTVLGRNDDHAGSALAYYGSRGETPLEWGGDLAERLGLLGAVTDETYDAIYGKGGAIDPLLGTRMVSATRPGVELVIAAHKSVAVLGVIGRADDMHALLDAETNATLAFIEEWFERQGGRRGKHHHRTATGGLLWAKTRHATSRAGDPAPHDHVLIANLTEMLDGVGGWRALDTAALRDLVHAATMIGRHASAELAVKLGYGVELDGGPTGKLGHWKIAGVAQEVMDVLSKRSEDIDLAMESSGYRSYRARGVAARNTRAAKTDDSPDELLPLWIDDIETVGWTPTTVTSEIVDASASTHLTKRLSDADLAARARDLLAIDGELGKRKAFTRLDVIRVVSPVMHGLPKADLDRAVRAVIEHQDAIPLVGRPGARSRAWAGAESVAVERAIADTADRLAARPAGKVADRIADLTIAAKVRALGGQLTWDQRDAVTAICTGGRGLDLVVGVAGAGKTTALDVVRAAFETEGYRVVGTATSGQATRALADDARVEARTIASLLARLRTRSLVLGDRTVVLLDEAGMTDDRDLLSVLAAAEAARSKVVVIGDHRQLSAVGSGGGLEALVNRNADAVHEIRENVRQRMPGERRALEHLRAGDLTKAVAWYRRNDRIVTAPTRQDAIAAAVDRWYADVSAGATTMLLAWRRADVAALNAAARQRIRSELGDAEWLAPGGRAYAAGDRIVALAPTNDQVMATSERGTVVAVHEDGISIRTDRGLTTRLAGTDADGSHVDHAYAVTVHRAQGATVDTAHLLADGGGRELAYVAMSRARLTSHVHVVAENPDQAVDDLHREWSAERRDRWTLDADAPAEQGQLLQPHLARRSAGALRAAQLRVEVEAILGVSASGIGTDGRLARLDRELRRIEARSSRTAERDHGVEL